ncbi:hypothetical protein DER44DRAFT_764343 [Fusarium oxysporum]|nr:hypothetical protein DER44DRAFT_764343 [Fusarium oxysporum]
MNYLAKILGFALLFTTTAQAATDFSNAPQGAHYASGSREPVCTINQATDTVSCTRTEIQGVGNTNAVVSLAVTATFTGVCQNPGNQKVVEPFTDSATTTTTAAVTSTRNGRLIVGVQSATADDEEFLENFECPNERWTADVTDVVVTGFEYTLTFEGFDDPAILITG